VWWICEGWAIGVDALAYARLTHLGGSSAVGASSAILVSSESVPDRFRRTIVDLQAQADFWVSFFWFSQRRLDSDADGQQWLALPPKFPSTSVCHDVA
jgi:hypothetical protein